MNHQTFNKKFYGFLLYFTFQGLHSLFLSAFIPYYIELLSILLQKYNPVVTKTDIGRRKDERKIKLQMKYNIHTAGSSFLNVTNTILAT